MLQFSHVCLCEKGLMYVLLLAGESLLVTTGLVIYFGDMMAYTASKVGFTIFNSPIAWSLGDQLFLFD